MAKTPAKKPWPWSPVGLLDLLTENVSIQDLDMRIVYVNPATRKMYGEDLIGKFCYRVYDHREEPCPDCPIQESFRTGEPASVVRVGRDGNNRPWFGDIMATPLKDTAGDLVGAIEVVRNVTERKLIEQASDRRYRETAALADVAVALNSHRELKDLLVVALERSADVCGADGGLIRLVNRRTGELETKAWHTKTGQDICELILPPQKIGVGLVGAAAELGDIQIIDDLSTISGDDDPPHLTGLLRLGIRSIVIVPLRTKGNLLGTMALGSLKAKNFGSADRGLLAAIGGQVSISIENASLLEETRRSAKVIAGYSKKLETEVRVKIKELAASERKFRTLVENSNTAIVAYDATGRIVEANQAAESLLKCSRARLIGNTLEAIECCPQFTTVLPDVLAGRHLNGYEHDILTGVGETLSVVANTAPILGESGEVVGAISTMIDISARKRLEEQLALEKTNAEQVLNSLPIGVHIYDHNEVFVDANITFMEMAAGNDYRGKTLDEIFGPDPRPALRRVTRSVRRCLAGKSFADEFYNTLRDIWMYVRYVPIDRGGRTQALIITEDVTEKVRLQQELRQYTQKLEKMVARRTVQLSASEGRYRRRNEELAALNSLIQLVNRSLNVKKMLKQALPKMMSVIEAEEGLVLISNKNGELTPAVAKNLSSAEIDLIAATVEEKGLGSCICVLPDWPRGGSCMVVPLTHKEEVLGLVCLCDRVGRGSSASDKRLMSALGAGIGMALKNARLFEEAEEKNRTITKAFVELEELDKLKSEFVSLVSHELRTPLAAIKGYVEVVKDGLAGPVTVAQKDKLKKADRRVDELTTLIADLLDLSAMETRKLKLKMREAGVASIIASALAGVDHLARAREIEISAVVKPTDLRIRCDSDKLVRALANMLENAIKFTPTGGRVEIVVRERQKSVTFTVSDSGVGISRADLPKIFDRFFVGREHAAGGGTGLGLAIVKGIVEAHGGDVWAESGKAGGGTTFLFELPKKGEVTGNG